uniref:Uncharacterized protein n=1 Tax=Arundo donax TaxID=35708 RepID=A0A0A9M8Z2_ARUDO
MKRTITTKRVRMTLRGTVTYCFSLLLKSRTQIILQQKIEQKSCILKHSQFNI